MKYLIILSLFLCISGCMSNEETEKITSYMIAGKFSVVCLDTGSGAYKFIASATGGYYSYVHLLEENDTGIHLATCKNPIN